MAETAIFYKMGFRMAWPDALRHPRGLVSPMEIGRQGDGTYFMMISYIALPAEELQAMAAKAEGGEMREEDTMKVSDAMGVLLVIIAIDGERGPEEIKAELKMGDVPEDSFTEIGRAGSLRYFAITDHAGEEAYRKMLDPVYAEEFRLLQQALIDALKNAEYFGPQIPGADLVGKTIRFETEDLDGNPVSSEDLFQSHAVTMINIWATWCGPCRNELEELGKLHRRLENRNAAIIGICDDAAEKADECRALIREKNLSYINILPYAGMDELSVQAFPTSFFVDREGKIMTFPMIGVPADISEYEKTVIRLLEGDSTGNADVKKKHWKVIVKDEDGARIAGVTVQFCNDTSCMIGRTDDTGTALFTAGPGQYTVHIQKVPEGYETCTDEIPAAPETAVVLQKKPV